MSLLLLLCVWMVVFLSSFCLYLVQNVWNIKFLYTIHTVFVSYIDKDQGWGDTTEIKIDKPANNKKKLLTIKCKIPHAGDNRSCDGNFKNHANEMGSEKQFKHISLFSASHVHQVCLPHTVCLVFQGPAVRKRWQSIFVVLIILKCLFEG